MQKPKMGVELPVCSVLTYRPHHMGLRKYIQNDCIGTQRKTGGADAVALALGAVAVDGEVWSGSTTRPPMARIVLTLLGKMSLESQSQSHSDTDEGF